VDTWPQTGATPENWDSTIPNNQISGRLNNIPVDFFYIVSACFLLHKQHTSSALTILIQHVVMSSDKPLLIRSHSEGKLG